MRRIHLTGAAGSGVSSIGAMLAKRLQIPHFDTDAFYWDDSCGHFEGKLAEAERIRRLRCAFRSSPGGWVLSGSITGWGDPLLPEIDGIVFVVTDTRARVRRIIAREKAKLGASVRPGGVRRAQMRDFVRWAAQYNTGGAPGRSLQRHRAWLAQARKPAIQIDGAAPVADSVEVIAAWLDA